MLAVQIAVLAITIRMTPITTAETMAEVTAGPMVEMAAIERERLLTTGSSDRASLRRVKKWIRCFG
jgi:hypothetical protein